MLRSLLLRASRSTFLESQFRKRGVSRRAIRRFMPGEDLESALAAGKVLQDRGLGVVLTRLGEEVYDAGEADAVVAHYLDVLKQVAARKLDAEISVKPTQLGLAIGSADDPRRRDGYAVAERNLDRLALAAAAHGSTLWVDMEGSEYVDATLDLVRSVRSRHASIGVCLQSYLRRTSDDLATLVDPPVRVRLVKGAYREPRSIAYPRKADVDRAFVDLARRIMDDRAWFDAAPPHFGTHDLDILRDVVRLAAERGIPAESVQITMLYGIRSAAQHRLSDEGLTVRTLISYGEAWYPWYVRRLAERPANLWFVLRSMLE